MVGGCIIFGNGRFLFMYRKFRVAKELPVCVNKLFMSLSQLKIFFALISVLFVAPVWADSTSNTNTSQVQPILHILDYVAVDYPGVFHNGKIENKQEYAEQKEFAGRLVTLSTQLPESTQKAALVKMAKRIQRAIAQQTPAAQVAKLCGEMTTQLINSYKVNVAPRIAPDSAGVSVLYQENCAVCHGAEGFGNGPNARNIEPHPANFHDQVRQQHRNVYSLYNTISLGVEGTAMRSFSELSSQQRWQLAFFVSNFYSDSGARHEGEKIWYETKSNPAIASLQQLTQITPAQIRQAHGQKGVDLLAYLRANPAQLSTSKISPWQFARESLTNSLVAYAKGDKTSAYEMSVAAYLEGFELVETQLNAVAPDLRKQIEKDMMDYRALIKSDAELDTLRQSQSNIVALLQEAHDRLDSNSASGAVNFFSALLILLREGIEAILILAAIAAVLNKSGRKDGMRYLHYGWTSALVLGFITWYVAAHTITISGANREFTEGITALVAAVMLVYVGFWLHKQTYAMQWQEFIRTKISRSLSTGALTGLAAVAFLAVYREVFETILFFETLSLQSGPSGLVFVVSGGLSAAVLLVVLAWLIFKFSVRLPMKLFFRINAVFLYALAVVFTGKGIAALQKAGLVPINSINIFEIDALGVYPNLQSLGTQLLMVFIALGLFWYSRRKLTRNL